MTLAVDPHGQAGRGVAVDHPAAEGGRVRRIEGDPVAPETIVGRRGDRRRADGERAPFFDSLMPVVALSIWFAPVPASAISSVTPSVLSRNGPKEIDHRRRLLEANVCHGVSSFGWRSDVRRGAQPGIGGRPAHGAPAHLGEGDGRILAQKDVELGPAAGTEFGPIRGGDERGGAVEKAREDGAGDLQGRAAPRAR